MRVWPHGASDSCECPGSLRRDWLVSRRHPVPQVIKINLPVKPALTAPLRPRHPRTGRGQCREPQTLQITRAADISRIRNHEAIGLVQLPEGAAAGGYV